MNEKIFSYASMLLNSIERIQLENSHKKIFVELVEELYNPNCNDDVILKLIDFHHIVSETYNTSFNPKIGSISDILSLYYNKPTKSFDKLLSKVDAVLENADVD